MADECLNREQWLERVAACLNTLFAENGKPLPKYKVSCGFPSKGGLANYKRTLGQCFSPKSSEGGNCEIFINPCVADSLEAGAILVHELVHAAVGTEHGHRKDFRHLAVAVGLEGKMTVSTASTKLKDKLSEIFIGVGQYPHAPITHHDLNKDGTRLLKVICPNCGYKIRTTHYWIQRGLPTCCCGAGMILGAIPTNP
jgi:hypothetical protein